MNVAWIWKSMVAGFCGTVAHYALMYFGYPENCVET
jgi:hypothetical protein